MMFFTKKGVINHLENYYENEKSKIDRDLRSYRSSQEEEIKTDLCDTQMLANNQWKKFEHEFHSKMEERKIEIAKLDALIEAKKDLLTEKDKTIAFMKGLIEKTLEAINSGGNGISNVSNEIKK